MWYRFAALLVFAAAILGCNQQAASEATAQSSDGAAPVLKVAVFADGRLIVDGVPSSLEELRESFKKLREQGGMVWYYRESGQDEPPPIAMEVVEAVIEAKLSVRLSSRPDYSDSVGP